MPCDQPLNSISCGPGNVGSTSDNHFYQIWAVGRNGSAFWRSGVSETKPQGKFSNKCMSQKYIHLKKNGGNHLVCLFLNSIFLF